MATARTTALLQELLGRKSTRNTLLALALITLTYMLYPRLGANVSSASYQVMKDFKTQDPVGGVPLRVLPMGDSITEGFGSTTFNSYRLELLEALTIRGAQITYIGALHKGTMDNNDNDGFWGRTISEVAELSKPSWKKMPNVVLLHVGTNDMNNEPPDDPYEDAPRRLGIVLDDLTAAIPNVTVIVAQVISSLLPGTKERIPRFNAGVPDIVHQRVSAGAKIQMVDMSAIAADATTTGDGLHPNDAGYHLMSVVWLKGLQAATKKGWLTPPAEQHSTDIPPVQS